MSHMFIYDVPALTIYKAQNIQMHEIRAISCVNFPTERKTALYLDGP